MSAVPNLGYLPIQTDGPVGRTDRLGRRLRQHVSFRFRRHTTSGNGEGITKVCCNARHVTSARDDVPGPKAPAEFANGWGIDR
jgi:hypothetical protein